MMFWFAGLTVGVVALASGFLVWAYETWRDA
jgi:hypothetical protein